MDPFTLRMVERWIALLAGAISLILGYRLFRAGVIVNQQGEIKILDKLSFTATRVGPGIFFAIFGCVILVVSYMSPVTHDSKTVISPTTSQPSGVPVYEASVRWGGVSSLAAFDPLLAIQAINAVEQDLEDKDPNYFHSPSSVSLKGRLAELRDALIWQGLPDKRDELRKYFTARTSGRPAEEFGVTQDDSRHFNAILKARPSAAE